MILKFPIAISNFHSYFLIFLMYQHFLCQNWRKFKTTEYSSLIGRLLSDFVKKCENCKHRFRATATINKTVIFHGIWGKHSAMKQGKVRKYVVNQVSKIYLGLSRFLIHNVVRDI